MVYLLTTEINSAVVIGGLVIGVLIPQSTIPEKHQCMLLQDLKALQIVKVMKGMSTYIGI